MIKIIFPEWHNSGILTKWGWRAWVFLYFMVSGSCCLVTVHQPPVITAALGHDVTMPCQLSLSPDETLLTVPVLYWVSISQDAEEHRLWKPSGIYEGRVQLLDENPNSLNKSILLQNVQWADNRKYKCKLSINTEKAKGFRSKGNETLLTVYDAMTFNLAAPNDSLLHCEINVTREPGFVLSIDHNGHKTQSVDSAPGVPVVARPYVTLSETISLRGGGKYECQLHLNKDLITKSILHLLLPGVVEYPEPWLLYAALLLVPVTFLLVLVPVLLCRC
ncbi:uncharacterized protein LOC117777218 isoform X1 [Hippoglossus hippoglossus]|uniref:uncharacterized protein LOC117777218 isoform X1 n=2 Tax=Hippoglossus hippoglossus TaxID=8267 RepID=UPI00148CE6FD|nr:uncharacterized protein LOC117777218 isoform X1 [Hippoglossus hippoglossus]XP_034467740.1 uncharacterized protein LOC117777218 isoform X1 [Hippoglossus hippoglossus]